MYLEALTLLNGLKTLSPEIVKTVLAGSTFAEANSNGVRVPCVICDYKSPNLLRFENKERIVSHDFYVSVMVEDKPMPEFETLQRLEQVTDSVLNAIQEAFPKKSVSLLEADILDGQYGSIKVKTFAAIITIQA